MCDRFRMVPGRAVPRARWLGSGGQDSVGTGALGRLRGRADAGRRAQEQLEEQPPGSVGVRLTELAPQRHRRTIPAEPVPRPVADVRAAAAVPKRRSVPGTVRPRPGAGLTHSWCRPCNGCRRSTLGELRSGRASVREALAVDVLGPVDSLGYQMRRHLIRAEPLNTGDISKGQAQVLTGEFTPALVRSPDTSPVSHHWGCA